MLNVTSVYFFVVILDLIVSIPWRSVLPLKNETPHEKTNDLGFRPGPTQIRLYSHRSRLEAGKLGLKKKRDCTICVAKTKVLICSIVFTYADCWFSHVAAQIVLHSFSKFIFLIVITKLIIFSFVFKL